jgi:hypothetical protein
VVRAETAGWAGDTFCKLVVLIKLYFNKIVKNMTWDEYRLNYLDATIFIYQAQIATRVALLVLYDYPDSLPNGLLKELDIKRKEVAKWLEEWKSHKDGATLTLSDSKIPQKEHPNLEDVNIDLLVPDLMLTIASFHRKKIKDENIMSFKNVMYSQQLIMTFAYLDAFMAESLRIICMICPHVLKSNKKIEWETILNLGNWERIEEHFRESYVFSFGWESVTTRIIKMQNDLGLELSIPNEILSKLDESELMRNIVVHNGGRVSAEFLKRTGRTDVIVGQQIPISHDFVDSTTYAACSVIKVLFADVSKKYFKKDDKELSDVIDHSRKAK